MQIYIDESGSFVSALLAGSWNVVAAVAMPESARLKIDKSFKLLKLSTGTNVLNEIKLNDIPEFQYLAFLESLLQTDLLLFATATDAGYNTPDRIARHQKGQVEKIRENIPRMRFEGGMQGFKLLADQLEVIPLQLYAQLVCQVDLLHDVVSRSINYFAQRIPGTLTEFRWRIDQKNTSKTTYEKAFEDIAPALLQTRSLREPAFRIAGFDYRRMSAYEFPNGEPPQYLAQEYGIHVEQGLNIQKLIRGNLKFEDSKLSLGIQLADLLASGLRRCLRGGFQNNEAASQALGKLTLQNQRGKYPIHLISFAELEGQADPVASKAVKIMKQFCRPMLKGVKH
jgi:Protein of unknown function (DUF3800)